MNKAYLRASAVMVLVSALPDRVAAAEVEAITAASASASAGRPQLGSFGFDVAGMDRATAPGVDFNRFANGTYLAGLEIPPDQASYSMFNKLRDLSQERTRGIVEAAAVQAAAADGEVRKVGDYYASFMDEAAIEAKGWAPIRPQLDAIAAIGDASGLAAAFGQAARDGVSTPFGLRVDQDLKSPEVMSVYVAQSGLSLPDRDYYVDAANPRFTAVRAAYAKHVAAMLALAGVADAPVRAARVVALETRIAAAHWTSVERRQVDKSYNPVASDAILASYRGLDWQAMLAAAGLGGEQRIVVRNPSAIAGAAALVASEPLAVWKDYLTFQTLRARAAVLPKAFVDESFAFNGTVLNGQPQLQPRWKRGVDQTSAALGEAVGKLYVAQYFPPDAKAKADALVKNVVAAMDARLARLAWMAPATRTAARAKLGVFKAKIGYPDVWRDYSGLDVVRGDALGNAVRAAQFEYKRQVDKLGKPIDRSEWGMTPMTVNAYARPTWNEIVFPAAILQPPFFDPAADPAINYGGIGVVIGHEISHHFDDQGRKYDKDGKLAEWWTAEDVTRFKGLTDRVVAQYGTYEPLPGMKVNGGLTLGENIADLAGLTVAYDAYQRSLAGKPAPVIDGFSGDQRLFLGFAQIWRAKYRDAAMLRTLASDPHTPGNFRANVVRNLDSWYSAFGAKPGEALFLTPEERVRVW